MPAAARRRHDGSAAHPPRPGLSAPGRAAAFAAGISRHDISSHAAGEALAEIVALGVTGADLTVVAVTPGHAGALEDIAATVAATLPGGVVVGLTCPAVGLGAAAPGPGLAVWAGRTGPVGVLSPGTAPMIAGQPGAGVVLVGDDGALALPVLGAALVDGEPRTGTTLRIAGPWSVVALPGVRDLGPPLRVSAAAGRTVERLDGVPAIERITDVAHRHLAAADLATAGARLCLRLPGGPPVALAGFERTSGAVVLADDLAALDLTQRTDALVRLCLPDVERATADLTVLTDRLRRNVGEGGGGAIAVQATTAGSGVATTGDPTTDDRPIAGPDPRRDDAPSLPTLVLAGLPRSPDASAPTGPQPLRAALFPHP